MKGSPVRVRASALRICRHFQRFASLLTFSSSAPCEHRANTKTRITLFSRADGRVAPSSQLNPHLRAVLERSRSAIGSAAGQAQHANADKVELRQVGAARRRQASETPFLRDGKSLDAIASDLTTKGVRAPHGRNTWTAATVRKAFVS